MSTQSATIHPVAGQASEMQQLHNRRVELLVTQDNLEFEIEARQEQLRAVKLELVSVRDKIVGSELARRELASVVSNAIDEKNSKS